MLFYGKMIIELHLAESLLQQKSNVDSVCVELNMFTIVLDAKLKCFEIELFILKLIFPFITEGL